MDSNSIVSHLKEELENRQLIEQSGSSWGDPVEWIIVTVNEGDFSSNILEIISFSWDSLTAEDFRRIIRGVNREHVVSLFNMLDEGQQFVVLNCLAEAEDVSLVGCLDLSKVKDAILFPDDEVHVRQIFNLLTDGQIKEFFSGIKDKKKLLELFRRLSVDQLQIAKNILCS